MVQQSNEVPSVKIRFWGVRGSIASPGPNTVRYGGNTSCIQVTTDAGDQIILDAGTGIRGVGMELMKNLPAKCSIFISHTHWDHIQGLPFFIPMFVPGNEIDLYGGADPVSRLDLKEVLNRQMEYAYFPVRQAELKASIEHFNVKDSDEIQVGSATVKCVLMNHPVLTFGFLVKADGKSVFFTGDHEDPYNIYEPEDDFYEEYESLIAQKSEAIIGPVRGVDVLIGDSSYTKDEYPAKIGWGHNTFEKCIAMANNAGAKKLFFTHHEPNRTDDQLEAIIDDLRTRFPKEDGNPELAVAQEGLEIVL